MHSCAVHNVHASYVDRMCMLSVALQPNVDDDITPL